jgi:tetratricopeptide (TPR) repeat protein/transcriptional regulator with XRE-family HTH domain
MKTSHNLKELGAQLRAYRKAKGWSHEELAKRAGCAKNSIIHWEYGRVRPNKKKINAVGRALELNCFQLHALLRLAGYHGGPPIRNLPYLSSADFTGRADILRTLQQRFMQGGEKQQMQALVGLGGVGKTQVALRYAEQQDADYDVIWWVPSEEPASMQASYAALADCLELGIPAVVDMDSRAQAVKRWFQENDCWLLILDNARSPGTVDKYLPVGGCGHVLITSRNPSWSVSAVQIEVEVFGEVEAIEFLELRTRRHGSPVSGELAHELGYLPLALEQAAAYMHEAALTVEQYLARWRAKGGMPPEGLDGPPGFSNTLAQTFRLSMDRVRAESPIAVDVLNLCAFLAPDGIPKDLLVPRMSDCRPTAMGIARAQLQLDAAIASLRRYSLVHAEPTTLSVHRLVQAMTREHLSETARLEWLGAAAQLLFSAYPIDGGRAQDWASPVTLLSHVLSVAKHTRLLGTDIQDTAFTASNHPLTSKVIGNLGLVLQSMGAVDQARIQLEYALTIAERNYGLDHPEVARTAHNLATVLQHLQTPADLQSAREHLERALTIDEKTYGPEHSSVAADAAASGSVLQDLHEWSLAGTYLEKALKIDEKLLGPEHPAVARDLLYLGEFLLECEEPPDRRAGNLAKAHELIERAIDIDGQPLGPQPGALGDDWNALGRVVKAQGELVKAREYFELALESDEAAFGPDHPAVARDLYNLGDLARAEGDVVTARDHLARAQRIFKERLGENHPHTIGTQKELEELNTPPTAARG